MFALESFKKVRDFICQSEGNVNVFLTWELLQHWCHEPPCCRTPLQFKFEMRLVLRTGLFSSNLILNQSQTCQLCQGPGSEQIVGWMCRIPPKNIFNFYNFFFLKKWNIKSAAEWICHSPPEDAPLTHSRCKCGKVCILYVLNLS